MRADAEGNLPCTRARRARLRIARLLAAGLGAGTSPVAPGTAGSLLGLLLGALLMREGVLAPGTAAVTCIGFWAIRAATGLPWHSARPADHIDPGWIVIDEVAGQMLAMLALRHLTLPGAAAAFALFRIFDIAKPGPIGWADRQPGAAGIMVDDLLAGVAAGLVLRLLQTLSGWPP